MFTQSKKASTKSSVRKLHSIHSLLIGREFKGEIEAGKANHQFIFTPASASVVNGRLELSGRLTVKMPGGQNRKSENIKASLLATQGGLTIGPPAPRTANTNLPAGRPSDGLPVTDATGNRGYVGVMYFKLSPLDGPALGLPFDLSEVQLNGRLNPADDTARALHYWYSLAVNAIYSKSPDTSLASSSVNEINQILRG
ncbi:MAG: hypothetical protein ABIU20_03470 [Blastocatellia bacterium]